MIVHYNLNYNCNLYLFINNIKYINRSSSKDWSHNTVYNKNKCNKISYYSVLLVLLQLMTLFIYVFIYKITSYTILF